MSLPSFNKQNLIEAFNRSAKTSQQAQTLSQAMSDRLLERLNIIKINPQIVLDMGAGTGNSMHELSRYYPQAKIIGVDIAKKRLFEAKKNAPYIYVCGDIEDLPLKDHSVDLVFSNLTLQWCIHLSLAFHHIRRILRPGGVFLFSTLGVDTLQEIRESWGFVDHQAHTYQFLDMHHVGDALIQAGFQDPVMDMEHLTLEYPNLPTFLSHLKKNGVTYRPPPNTCGLLGKNRYSQFISRMEQKNNREGILPITYEIIYGYAMSKFITVQE